MSAEVLKIFFYCLAFGFSGAFQPNDPSLFRLRGRLYERIRPEADISAERLFPDAYRVYLGKATKLKRLWKWWHIAVALILFFTIQVLVESAIVWPLILGDVADNVDTARSVTTNSVEEEKTEENKISGYTIRLGQFDSEADARALSDKVTQLTGQCKIFRFAAPGQQDTYYVVSGHFFNIEEAAKKFEIISSSLPLRTDSSIVEYGKVPGECISGC